MKNYKMNLTTNTLTITKEFAAKAMIPNSEESTILLHIQSICPNLKIAYKTHKKSSTPNPRKGLTFDKMERYIRLYDNADELLLAFSKVKAFADFQPNKYEYVYKWFNTQFPNYREFPQFTDGKLITEVINFPTVSNVEYVA